MNKKHPARLPRFGTTNTKGQGPIPIIRRALRTDINAIATINAEVFLGHRGDSKTAKRWALCFFRTWPAYQIYVIEVHGIIAGYIGWQCHGGFLRPEPVVELEQLGISPKFQGRRFGPLLTDESFKAVLASIIKLNKRIESHVTVIVWGYTLNLSAMKVYADWFTDGPAGFRVQYGNRPETMFRKRVPWIKALNGFPKK